MSRPANPVTLPLAEYMPKHFLLAVSGKVATVTLNRPERKNPLTFESYRELTDFFRACAMDDEVKTVVVTGAGGNFSSGGDVFEGDEFNISDGNSVTWGANVTAGSSSGHTLVRWNGSNWTVVGK